MTSLKGRHNCRPPRPSVAAPAGCMSAPRRDVLLLAAPGSQIYDGSGWWTIRHIGPCHIPAHPAPCWIFHLPGRGTPLLHWQMSVEGWIRHPVAGAL